jgi:hypothetical protein
MNLKSLSLTVVVVAFAASVLACQPRDQATADAEPVDLSRLREFDEFPVLWLGESYDSDGDGTGDMAIREARASQSPPFVHPRSGEVIRAAARSFDVMYGDCEIPPGSDSCRVPLTMIFYPAGPAQELSNWVKTGEVVLVRGIPAVVFGDGNLWVETEQVTFTISAWGESPEERLETATRILTKLEGANPPASDITQGSLLRPKPRVFPTATPPGAGPTPMNTPTPAGSPSATPASAPTTEPDTQ